MAIDVRAIPTPEVFDRQHWRLKRKPTVPARNTKVAIISAEADVALIGSAK
jgi:hypothetical protein